MLEVYRRALGLYRPTPYSGSMAIFLESNPDRASIAAWDVLGVSARVHRLDTEHDALLDRPAIGAWATLLAHALDPSTAAPSNL